MPHCGPLPGKVDHVKDEDERVHFTRAASYANDGAWSVLLGRRRIGSAMPNPASGGGPSRRWLAHHANGLFLNYARTRRHAARIILQAEITFTDPAAS